ncbi:ABC transporter ATP-binding protein [Yimella sp. cx-51]|uniref:ABC transporter ATP-binding protein n=1 Tax=Yimella sp. cx-51 TaxID=2770551 RepID=UPI00165D93B7|nr:ABC transporter ATP-binding protein [Yimella sp. cx-51]MBC9958136.1 ATP-binding cassette domain-containing protein [Yimella sp. cx-51]QTH38826.1 ATP-binding cassette domain-containing protein [Yimella sp. cx-51]
MIQLDGVGVQYVGADAPALQDVDLHIPEGEFALVVGTTGVGKSTLLGAMNGLVPHFTGGRLRGRVTVGGYDTRQHPPREMADVVGRVGQDPVAGFVTDTVEEELAYGMEQLAVPPTVMRKRVEEVLDLLGIADLRSRPLHMLSGGQQQRVAIGSALTTQPQVLILDEPTSALDPTAAEDVLAAVTRLVHDLGTTVVIAEHRMERVVQYADSLVLLPGSGRVVHGPAATLMQDSPIAPPVVELGRLAGWQPLPLSVRDARRSAASLRNGLAGKHIERVERRPSDGPPALQAKKVTVTYGPKVAVREVDVTLRPGTVTALMGRNGSGKSTLMWALQGALPRHSGSVRVGDIDPAQVSPERSRAAVGLVPQSAADLLYLQTVRAECETADTAAGREPGRCRALLDSLVSGIRDEQHPRDLSEGQRLALVLAVQLTAQPPVLLLDEPTRGLDYSAKAQLHKQLDLLAAQGHSVMVATHDVEFVAQVADRVMVMAEGELIADGPTDEVIASSPIFAPQVAKVLHPLPYLTVDQVRRAMQVSA